MNYNPMDYVNSTTRVRALETRMATAADFRKMVDAKSAEEAFKVLADAGLCAGYSVEDYEQAFEYSMNEAFELVAKLSPQPRIAALFRYPYDGLNLKIAIKSERMDGDQSGLFTTLGNVTPKQTVAELQSGGRPDSFAPALAAAAETARADFAKVGDPQAVDVLIDKGVLAAMKTCADEIGSGFISDYVRARIDIGNLRAAVRLSRMGRDVSALRDTLSEGGSLDLHELAAVYPKGIADLLDFLQHTPYGDALSPAFQEVAGGGSLTHFEKLCDNTLAARLQKAKTVSFGIEPVAAYLCAKELEIKAARIILASKLAGVSSAEIERRLRETFI